MRKTKRKKTMKLMISKLKQETISFNWLKKFLKLLLMLINFMIMKIVDDISRASEKIETSLFARNEQSNVSFLHEEKWQHVENNKRVHSPLILLKLNLERRMFIFENCNLAISRYYESLQIEIFKYEQLNQVKL